MKRTIFMSLLLAATAIPVVAQDAGDLVGSRRQYIGSGNPNMNPLYLWAYWIQNQVLGGNQAGTGRTFYVDSGVTNEGDGTTWAKAKNTLDEAINLCEANRGDRILVAQGHAENLTAADAVDADIAGISIIGCGNGSLMPTFTATATGGEFVIGAAGVTISGLRFAAGISAVTMGISV
jgi:hypothetical protein